MQAQVDEITRLTDELNGYHNVNICSNMPSPTNSHYQMALQQPASNTCSQQTVLDMEALDTLLVNLDLSNTEEKGNESMEHRVSENTRAHIGRYKENGCQKFTHSIK